MLHGDTQVRGHNPPESQFNARGRFGRLFPGLPVFAPDTEKVREALFELGKVGGLMDAGPLPANNPDNETIPAGFTFFGQFVDHDLTFDPTSILERQNDPEAIENFRTPTLELDNVYGSGPRASRHLYDVNDPAKFLIEKLGGPGSNDDMPRNSQQTALIGDPRNDENSIVSQMHVAFLKFHNAVVDHVRAKGNTPEAQVFEKAQRMVRWHYQWIILNEFLPKIVGEKVVKDVLDDRPRERIFGWRNEPFIPVEFAVAAYRFGHSQVRGGYTLNRNFNQPLFVKALPANTDPDDLRGGKRAERRFVEWSRFFEGLGDTAQDALTLSKRIDSKLSTPLLALITGAPGQVAGPGVGTLNNPESLAQRNLLRGLALRLASGQAMAKRLGIKPLVLDELKQFGVGFEHSSPPWFYILKESELEKGNQGRRLGPVGGRIVAEVFVGVLRGDRFSFLNANPNWRPELANAQGQFLMADLMKFAGVPLRPPAAASAA
ncbi:MAG TPA: heme peroxidase family protein [Archangium sp.]|jgi:hypothetical protein|uniref:peroxidase family protein n=1 Tax=Archangium sp. TaxID=1872627 RepID=UPI002EDAC0BE